MDRLFCRVSYGKTAPRGLPSATELKATHQSHLANDVTMYPYVTIGAKIIPHPFPFRNSVISQAIPGPCTLQRRKYPWRERKKERHFHKLQFFIGLSLFIFFVSRADGSLWHAIITVFFFSFFFFISIMHSYIRPHEYVALRLMSDTTKIIQLVPNTYVFNPFVLCVSTSSLVVKSSG